MVDDSQLLTNGWWLLMIMTPLNTTVYWGSQTLGDECPGDQFFSIQASEKTWICMMCLRISPPNVGPRNEQFQHDQALSFTKSCYFNRGHYWMIEECFLDVFGWYCRCQTFIHVALGQFNAPGNAGSGHFPSRNNHLILKNVGIWHLISAHLGYPMFVPFQCVTLESSSLTAAKRKRPGRLRNHWWRKFSWWSHASWSMAISGTQIGGTYHIYGLCQGYARIYDSYPQDIPKYSTVPPF